jgi:hypothetical protein
MISKQTVKTKVSGTCTEAYAFKKGYKPKNNLVKEQKSDLFADSHNTVTYMSDYRWSSE